jgi:mRNA interferase RelE/StbE
MTSLSVAKARGTLAETLNRVTYRGERVVIQKRGKPVAALVPVEDLRLLEQLEDRLDLEAARQALAEARGRRIPWSTLKRQLGLWPVAYVITFNPVAARALAALDPPVRRRVARRIEALGTAPRPPGVQALAGGEDLLRVRVGDYRIIYRIEDRHLVVLIIRIGHRGEVYRQE